MEKYVFASVTFKVITSLNPYAVLLMLSSLSSEYIVNGK